MPGMPKPPRIAVGGVVYHVLNRANGRAKIFFEQGDYAAFERVLAKALDRTPMRLLSYCLMPNHWHLVLWPRDDGDLSRFMGWLTLTHAARWQAAHGTVGWGHLYQGRFKSFPVQTDAHFLTVCRYVERNALRAGLVAKAEDWRWGSLWGRRHGDVESKALLSAWPVAIPANWLKFVNQPMREAELMDIRDCVNRGRPYGTEAWIRTAAARLGLESTLRPRGRPMKQRR
jgi:putative transposase